jgi:8-oxo-dGTP diphosphatase
MKQKVMAYVVRRMAGEPELLVFEHRAFPAAGVQVPAGTVEPGETIEAGLLRELEEEAGLGPAQVRLVGKLAEAYETAHDQQRHVFVLAPVSALPDRWTHNVRGSGDDEGMVFEYFWLALTPTLKLTGDQGRFLHLI